MEHLTAHQLAIAVTVLGSLLLMAIAHIMRLADELRGYRRRERSEARAREARAYTAREERRMAQIMAEAVRDEHAA